MKYLFALFLFIIYSSTNAKTCAVIVGVEQYDGTVNNLSASVDDAEKMYAYLTVNKKNKVVFLKDKQATKANILYAMDKVYALAGKDDMIVFYFSGHGAPGMFCRTDVNWGKNGLLHTEIRAKFKKSKASSKLVIADACFSGSITENTSNQSNQTSTVPNNENIVIFMSSRDNETSIESRYINAGYFTYYFVQGMGGNADKNKDRKITLYELYAFVRKSVRSATQNKQTPVMYGHFNRNAVIGTY